MELSRLIAALSDPSSYPHPVDTVEVHQTHISVVFLAGSFAYKVKKPVALGFLDYGTPAKRRHFCHEEVSPEPSPLPGGLPRSRPRSRATARPSGSRAREKLSSGPSR